MGGNYRNRLTFICCVIMASDFSKLIFRIQDVIVCKIAVTLYTFKNITEFRSSCSKVFCKKGVFKNFANFTRKHLCQRLFFNKVAGLRPATLLKNRLWHRKWQFAKFSGTPFFIEHLQWVLLENSVVLFFCEAVYNPYNNVLFESLFMFYSNISCRCFPARKHFQKSFHCKERLKK